MASQDPKSNPERNKSLRNLLFILVAVAGIVYGLASL